MLKWRERIQMNSGQETSIGVDVGGTSAKLGRISRTGEILEKKSISISRNMSAEDALHEIVAGVRGFIEKIDPVSIGFGLPGATNSETGTLLFAPNLNWRNINLRNILSKEYSCPLFFDQDSCAAAFGEFIAGGWKDRNKKNLVCVTLGTGIGCGLILNGKIYKGLNHTMGELGHTVVDPDGAPCACGKKGCLETYVSLYSLLEKAKGEINGLRNNTDSVKDIFSFADRGNPGAKKIVDEYITYLGTAIANVINVLCPEVLVISGGISNASDGLLFNPLKKFILGNIYPLLSEEIIITKSEFGPDAPLIGASMLYRREVG